MCPANNINSTSQNISCTRLFVYPGSYCRAQSRANRLRTFPLSTEFWPLGRNHWNLQHTVGDRDGCDVYIHTLAIKQFINYNNYNMEVRQFQWSEIYITSGNICGFLFTIDKCQFLVSSWLAAGRRPIWRLQNYQELVGYRRSSRRVPVDRNDSFFTWLATSYWEGADGLELNALIPTKFWIRMRKLCQLPGWTKNLILL